MMRRSGFLLLLAAMLAVSLPLHAEDVVDDNDPIEGFNRVIFQFNHALDVAIIRPVAWTYNKVVPEYGRNRVNYFFTNLNEPINFVNALLQGDATQAFTTFWRFTINTTVGIAGLYDQATPAGLQYRQEDFGQTLGHYGMGPGFYLVLPVLGPSSARDGVGRVADWFTSPVTYVDNDWITWGLAVGEGLNYRAQILDITDNIDRSSIDPYATYRSAFLQRRQDLINNGTSRKF